VLIGHKGVGKTTIGQLLAHHKRCLFIDTDHLLEKPAPQLHKELGEIKFRQKELEILKTLDFSKQSVIALGGGALLAQFQFPKCATLVYLYRPKEMFDPKKGPTFVEDFDLYFKERKKLYEQYADVKIDMTKYSQADMLDLLTKLF
jgi:shikimate kinase